MLNKYQLSVSAMALLIGLGATLAAQAQTTTDNSAPVNADVTATAQANADALNSLLDQNSALELQIQQGLQSGALTADEAARLQRNAARINRAEGRVLRDSDLSSQELARIQRMQQEELNRIQVMGTNDAKVEAGTNDQLAQYLQRSINQQNRIDNGFDDGSLTIDEVAALEKGQSILAKVQARTVRDGTITPREQALLQEVAAAQSANIHLQRHDDNAVDNNATSADGHNRFGNRVMDGRRDIAAFNRAHHMNETVVADQSGTNGGTSTSTGTSTNTGTSTGTSAPADSQSTLNTGASATVDSQSTLSSTGKNNTLANTTAGIAQPGIATLDANAMQNVTAPATGMAASVSLNAGSPAAVTTPSAATSAIPHGAANVPRPHANVTTSAAARR